MKKQLALIALSTCFAMTAIADDEITTAENQAQEETKKGDYVSRVQEKYNLSNEQITSMQNSSISTSQFAIVASLAEQSGKTVDEILKMRTEEKMGWGKIAKELNVKPGSIGQSIAEMHRKNKRDAASAHELREARREEKREMREEKKRARKEARSQRKENKTH